MILSCTGLPRRNRRSRPLDQCGHPPRSLANGGRFREPLLDRCRGRNGFSGCYRCLCRDTDCRSHAAGRTWRHRSGLDGCVLVDKFWTCCDGEVSTYYYPAIGSSRNRGYPLNSAHELAMAAQTPRTRKTGRDSGVPGRRARASAPSLEARDRDIAAGLSLPVERLRAMLSAVVPARRRGEVRWYRGRTSR